MDVGQPENDADDYSTWPSYPPTATSKGAPSRQGAPELAFQVKLGNGTTPPAVKVLAKDSDGIYYC